MIQLSVKLCLVWNILICQTYDMKVCRWTHHVVFSAARYIFQLLLFPLRACACLWFIRLKVWSAPLVVPIVFKKIFKSIDATSSLPLLYGLLDSNTFWFELLLSLIVVFWVGCFLSFLHQPLCFGIFVFLVDFIHDLFVRPPVIAFMRKFLFIFKSVKSI